MITYHIDIYRDECVISILYTEPLDLGELINLIINFIDRKGVCRVYDKSINRQEVIIDISSANKIFEGEKLIKPLIGIIGHEYNGKYIIEELHLFIRYKQYGFPMKFKYTSGEVAVRINNIENYEYKDDSMILTVRNSYIHGQRGSQPKYTTIIYNNIAEHKCSIGAYNEALTRLLDFDSTNKLNITYVNFTDLYGEKHFIKYSTHKALVARMSAFMSDLYHTRGSLLNAEDNRNGPWRRKLFDLICLNTENFADDLMFSPQIFNKISGYLCE